jgi:DivIVA domain-containing protein
VLEAVVFVLIVGVVGALLFLGGSVLLGRGETRPPADPDRSPLELPEDRPVTADDVRGVRMSVTVRGYRMTEVDWLLEQLAQALEERDAAIAALRARLEQAGRTPGTDGAPPPGAGAGGNGAHADA